MQGTTTSTIHGQLEEEERQIQYQIAEEEMALQPPSFTNVHNQHIANLEEIDNQSKSKSASGPSTPIIATRDLLPRKGNSMDKLSSTLKSLKFGSGSQDKSEERDVVCNKAPSSLQLEQMHLIDGENTVKFITSITKQVAVAKLYLWDQNVKLIISDIDGTITKTDKRGLFFYKLGYDWTHDNVVNLYNMIAKNGYRFVYLTARSVKVQSATRTYLEKIDVPDNPIFCAPHNLLSCVTTEFWKTTAEGKMLHLNELRALFLKNPFMAGFGNRLHDHVCYNEIGISPERIYIVNKHSEVSVNGQKKTKYDTLIQVCSTLFPSVPTNA